MLNLRLLVILFATTLMICLGLSHDFLTLGEIRVGESATAQIIDLKPLIQQGVERYKAGDFQGAIAVWNTALNNQPSVADRVTVLKHLARVYPQVGQIDRTITSLNQLIAYYQKVGDRSQLGRMLIEQAQAYSSLGQQQKAIALLCGENQTESSCRNESALAIAQEQSDHLGEGAGLGSLGTIYRLRGDYETSLRLLQKSLAIAQSLKSPVHVTAAENELGNTYASLAKRDYRYVEFASDSNDVVAMEKFTQQAVEHDHNAVKFFAASLVAARQQHNLLNEMHSLLNLAVSYQRIKQSEAAETTLRQAFNVLDRLPDSHDKTYGLIRFVNLLQRPSAADGDPNVQCLPHIPAETITLLNRAIAIAQRIHDSQAESFALGRLGHLYECQQDFTQALKFTQQAQLMGQQQESRYLWDWQTGRILQAQGKPIAAIASYESSVKALKEIRGDLAIASRNSQFDFRDTVEPVYRELAQLQLQSATNKALEKNINLEAALKTIDSLRLAELQNYLGGDCSIALSEKPITSVGEKTAIISTIILKNRVAVILTSSSTNQRSPSKIYWLPAQTKTVMATVNDLRLKLEKRSDLANAYQEPAQQIYNWLIRPFAEDLQTAQIETLVFIQDGILRSIPMTALYNGKEFLVQQYAIASALSLNLTEPTRLDPHSLRVLEFGLTKSSAVAGQFFAPLSYVKTELDRIKTTLPESKEFIDEAFTTERLEQELTQSAFPIVHLATHGRFGIDSRDTFLVTGKYTQNNNETLTLNQLYRILQNKSLELLTLTACETAIGSDRDALGIAGISLQAGARSAIASLWQVDDQSIAELIGQFYQNLHQGMGRAKALQLAQKNWLQQHPGDRNHPGYWAALILVGNWL